MAAMRTATGHIQYNLVKKLARERHRLVRDGSVVRFEATQADLNGF